MAWSDSLERANDVFGKKLKYYTSAYPSTMYSYFNNLQGMIINTSEDELFRIYSWDTNMGGTMHDFENVFQYKYKEQTYSILDTAKDESDYVYLYSNLYTLKAGNKSYYLAVFDGIFSSHDMGEGIRVFSIENGKLVDTKLIKTQSGLHNKLYYDYDLFSIPGNLKDADIRYNLTLKIISLPVIVDKGKVTNRRITYKFTGQYFERVKN